MIVKIAVGFLTIYAGVLGGLYALQSRMLYIPDTRRISPIEAGLDGVREVVLERADGVEVISWYAAAQSGRPTLLYFHGNGGSLINRAERIALYRSVGLGVMMMTYRGYGGSGGRPSEKSNIADGLAAYDWLAEQGVSAERIHIYGESLGSGVAVAVGAERNSAGLILETPFSSIADVGADRFPWAPVRLALRDHYNSASRIAGVNAPVLVLHGKNDQVVPYKFGLKLFEAAVEPKTMKTYAEGRHNDLYSRGAWADIRSFLGQARSAGTR